MPTSNRPSSDRRTWILLTLCIAQFMLVLDISVTNVALASIQRALGFAVTDLQWIVTAYTITFGSLLIFFGRAGDLFGRRRLFELGLVLFTVASLLCGLTQHPWQLIAARAMQGLGAAMMSPAALSLLTTTFAEGAERNRALSIWGAITAGGAAAGMIIGGILTDLANWRWVFFINAPIGVFTLISVRAVVPDSRDEHRQPLDVAGAITITGGLVALVYGLTQTESKGIGSAVVLSWLSAAAALLVVFVIVERRVASPLVDGRVLRSSSVRGANLFSLVSSTVIVGQSFFLSLYLREILGYSPLRTGFALIPITIVVVAVAGVIPRVLPYLGVKITLTLAGLLLAVGMLLHARMPVGGSYLADVLPAIIVTAAGLGLGFVAATIAATTGVAAHQQGLASGILNTSQQVGGAVGLALLATIAASRTNNALANGAEPLKALVNGFSRGFITAAGLAVLAALAAAIYAPGRTSTGPSDSGKNSARTAEKAEVLQLKIGPE